MHGQGGRPRRHRVLYVGKSKNLRQRLNSYRHVNPDRDSRKTVRLVDCVESISYEVCESETSALLRENELLRAHRPLFNRANVRPEAYGYVGLSAERGRLGVVMSPVADGLLEWHGAFKGGRRYALMALLRLLAQRENGWTSWSEIPVPLSSDVMPGSMELELRGAHQVMRSVSRYLRGRSWEIVSELGACMEAQPTGEDFLQNWRRQDLELIRTFYLNGPRRNRRWRQQLGLKDDRLLSPEELDDLPVRIRLSPEPDPWGRADGEGNSVPASPVNDLP